jgi:hypothetical protein
MTAHQLPIRTARPNSKTAVTASVTTGDWTAHIWPMGQHTRTDVGHLRQQQMQLPSMQESNVLYPLQLLQFSMLRDSRRTMQQVAAAACACSRSGVLTSFVCPAPCRHSVVWNCVCKHTKKPIILKGYVKVRQQWQ